MSQTDGDPTNPIDSSNLFLVGSIGDGIRIMRMPGGVLTKEQALNLAANIVAQVDTSPDHEEFGRHLAAVENAGG